MITRVYDLWTDVFDDSGRKLGTVFHPPGTPADQAYTIALPGGVVHGRAEDLVERIRRERR